MKTLIINLSQNFSKPEGIPPSTALPKLYPKTPHKAFDELRANLLEVENVVRSNDPCSKLAKNRFDGQLNAVDFRVAHELITSRSRKNGSLWSHPNAENRIEGLAFKNGQNTELVLQEGNNSVLNKYTNLPRNYTVQPVSGHLNISLLSPISSSTCCSSSSSLSSRSTLSCSTFVIPAQHRRPAQIRDALSRGSFSAQSDADSEGSLQRPYLSSKALVSSPYKLRRLPSKLDMIHQKIDEDEHVSSVRSDAFASRRPKPLLRRSLKESSDTDSSCYWAPGQKPAHDLASPDEEHLTPLQIISRSRSLSETPIDLSKKVLKISNGETGENRGFNPPRRSRHLAYTRKPLSVCSEARAHSISGPTSQNQPRRPWSLHSPHSAPVTRAQAPPLRLTRRRSTNDMDWPKLKANSYILGEKMGEESYNITTPKAFPGSSRRKVSFNNSGRTTLSPYQDSQEDRLEQIADRIFFERRDLSSDPHIKKSCVKTGQPQRARLSKASYSYPAGQAKRKGHSTNKDCNLPSLLPAKIEICDETSSAPLSLKDIFSCTGWMNSPESKIYWAQFFVWAVLGSLLLASVIGILVVFLVYVASSSEMAPPDVDSSDIDFLSGFRGRNSGRFLFSSDNN